MTRQLMTTLAVLAALAGPAGAETPQLRPADAVRVDGLDAALGRAYRQAAATGAPADLAAVARALSGTDTGAGPQGLLGDWSCRTIKMGGLAGLVVYAPFRCRAVRTPDGGVMFEKLSGSQRVRGRVFDGPGRTLLAGVGFIAGDTPPDYDALPAQPDVQAGPQRLPAPGVVEITGPDRARILFPEPMVESVLDILELTR